MKCWYNNKRNRLTRKEEREIEKLMPRNIYECFSLVKTIKDRSDKKKEEIVDETSRN